MGFEFLVVLIPYILCKKFKIKTSETLLITFVFISASVTKAHMVIGQQSILILFFFCLPFISSSKLSLKKKNETINIDNNSSF